MKQVTITDARPQWQKDEDRFIACLLRCRLWRKCESLHGPDCKRLGGTKIPVVR